MARRRRRSDAGNGTVVLGVLILAAFVWTIDFVKANQDAVLGAIVIVIVVLIMGRIRRSQRQKAEAEQARQALEAQHARELVRRQYLLQRYNNVQIVDGIIGRQVWVGMTREQLVESWGYPHDIKETLLKTKRKEEFKYTNVGVNRYLSRVYLEDDAVVGWKQ